MRRRTAATTLRDGLRFRSRPAAGTVGGGTSRAGCAAGGVSTAGSPIGDRRVRGGRPLLDDGCRRLRGRFGHGRGGGHDRGDRGRLGRRYGSRRDRWRRGSGIDSSRALLHDHRRGEGARPGCRSGLARRTHLCDQLCTRWLALVRGLCHSPGDRCIEVGREIAANLREPGRGLGHVGPEQRDVVVPLERRRAGEHLVQHAGRRVEVGPAVAPTCPRSARARRSSACRRTVPSRSGRNASRPASRRRSRSGTRAHRNSTRRPLRSECSQA